MTNPAPMKGTQLQFDYGALDADTRRFVQERTERIHRVARMTAAGIVQIGQDLSDVKERLKHGQFLDWIKKEFGWERSSADRFMNVALRVKLPKLGNLEIDISALYLIAAPKTPEPVREEAIRQATSGPVTHATVKSVIQEYRKSGDGEVAVAKLFDVVKAAQQQQSAERKLLPSPAEARRAAIASGAHTLDRNGVMQPPMTVEAQERWKADLHSLSALRQFIDWVNTDRPDAERLLTMMDARGWRDEFNVEDAAQAGAWLTEFARRLHAKAKKVKA